MNLEEAILQDISSGNNFLTLEEIGAKHNCTSANVHTAIQKLIKENRLFRLKSMSKTAYFTYEQIRNRKLMEQFVEPGNTTDFKSINTSEGLVAYLRDTNRRLEKRAGVDAYVYHYTNINAIVGIIKSRFWYLSNPVNMNDGLEYNHASPDIWSRIFFSSFMSEAKESLAMWSMYAQPWDKGVMIAVPIKAFKRWVRSIDKVYKADPITKQVDKNTYVNRSETELFIMNVAYCNTDSIGRDGIEVTSCGNASNSVLKNVANDPKLVGYVKNEAWSYEKEVRLRVDLGEKEKYEAVALQVSDELIDSMIITKGPRFDGNLLDGIKKAISEVHTVKDSLFYGQFRSIPCDYCRIKGDK